MKMSEIAIDPERQEGGAWVKDIPELPGVELRVRGSECRAARKLRNALIDQIPRKRRVGGKVDPKDQEDITTALLHRVILLDWRGIEDDDDQPEAYSKERALTYISDPRYQTFRTGVLWASNVVAEQGEIADEDDVGNSQPSSDGNSTGEIGKSS